MAITENLEGTRAGSIDAAGARTLTRHFTVTGTDDVQVAIAEVDTLIKPYSATYNVGTDPISGATVNATYYGTKSWSRPEGTDETWNFIATYTTAPIGGAGGTGGEVYITTQGDTRATTKAVYRKNPDATNETNPIAAIDIGGSSVDQGGTPTSITAIDRRFSVTEKTVNFPNLGALSGLVGKRNNDVYEGGLAGTILYLSFSWNKDTTSGLWTINHQFAVDAETYHAVQVARTDANGDIVKVATVSGNTTIYNASHVFWVQPFPMASFAGLPSF
jgi:hypothetical protein